MAMTTILQSSIPYDVSDLRRLPAVQPLDMADWLIEDDAFAGQMALRDQLLAERREAVLAMDESVRPAAEELLDMVLERVYPGAGARVTRRDGVEVEIDRDAPLLTLGRLVQEDFNLLDKVGDEHVLKGSVLCFPAGWTLAEKFMKPMVRIHQPVAVYDENVAARVQRLFDGVQPDRPLWRFNALWYTRPELFLPRSETDKRHKVSPELASYLRSERQSILRLPKTRVVVFSIHTFVMARGAVTGSPELSTVA